MQGPAQYFPKGPAQPYVAQQMPVANSNILVFKPPMGPLGEYPPRGAPKERGSCYNCGSKEHSSPNCPYPKQDLGYVALCGNCGKEENLPPECPEPYKPKMLVRYAGEPP
jgi:hypothetical protein